MYPYGSNATPYGRLDTGVYENARTGVVNTRKACTRMQTAQTPVSKTQTPVWRKMLLAPVSNTRKSKSDSRTVCLYSRIETSREKATNSRVKHP